MTCEIIAACGLGNCCPDCLQSMRAEAEGAVMLHTAPRCQLHSAVCSQFFEGQGCKMVEMGCAEHDQQAASTQFITHTVGRVLGAMDLQASRIDTRGYQSLLDLVDNTTNDSFDLYYGLFMYNKARQLGRVVVGDWNRVAERSLPDPSMLYVK